MGITDVFKTKHFKNDIERLTAENNYLNSLLTPEMKTAVSINAEIQRLVGEKQTIQAEIEELKKHFIDQLFPIQIYLFGSYANGTYTDNSDLDFYIIVRDEISDLAEETTKAYKAIRKIKQRPVDIVVGTKSRFEARKKFPSVENEVYRKGVLLYKAGIERVV